MFVENKGRIIQIKKAANMGVGRLARKKGLILDASEKGKRVLARMRGVEMRGNLKLHTRPILGSCPMFNIDIIL